MIDSDRLQKIFIDLLNINSPSKDERQVADYLIPKLKSLGFEVYEDDTASKIDGNTGNIMAFKKGTISNAISILLSSHMDTVEPTSKLNLIFQDGIFKSDGTTILGADDKAGLAAIIEGVESYIASNKEHGDIQLSFDVAEEKAVMGAPYILKENIKADFCYVFDSGKPICAITTSAPTKASMVIEIFGKAAHAGVEPELGISSIQAASDAISKMKLGRIDDETTANIGTIEGGKARNIVADYVKISAEIRSRDDNKFNAQLAHMKQVFEAEASAIGASVKFDVTKNYYSYNLKPTDPIVKLAQKASEIIGIETSCRNNGGGSDANVFNHLGIPAVVIGVGYEDPHSVKENISLDMLVKCAEFVYTLIDVASKEKKNALKS